MRGWHFLSVNSRNVEWAQRPMRRPGTFRRPWPGTTRRELAVLLAGAVALGLAVSGAGTWPLGLEWLAPVYLLKLVGAHAVPPQG